MPSLIFAQVRAPATRTPTACAYLAGVAHAADTLVAVLATPAQPEWHNCASLSINEMCSARVQSQEHDVHSYGGFPVQVHNCYSAPSRLTCTGSGRWCRQLCTCRRWNRGCGLHRRATPAHSTSTAAYVWAAVSVLLSYGLTQPEPPPDPPLIYPHSHSPSAPTWQRLPVYGSRHSHSALPLLSVHLPLFLHGLGLHGLSCFCRQQVWRQVCS